MSLHTLPHDILHSLCAFLDTQSLLTLSHTHSAFYPSSQRYIYRHISIHSYDNALKCISSLHANRDHAPFVRSFALRLNPNADVLRAFVDMLADVIADMRNLASLDLVLPPGASRVLAAHARVPSLFYRVDADPFSASQEQDDALPLYPRLTSLSCNFSLDASLATFLERTPALTHLQLGDAPACANPLRGSNTTAPAQQQHQQTAQLTLPPTAVPNLSFFMGSSQDATLIAPGRPLESVHLYSGDLSESVFDALAQSSHPITIFGSFTHSLSPAILSALATSLPRLQHLRIMTMYSSQSQPNDMFYAQVVQMLATLPELVNAELAGIRWAPWKKNSSTSGSRSARGANSNATAQQQQQQQTQAPTPVPAH